MEAQFLTSTPSQEIDIHLYPMLRLVLMLIIGISLGYSFYASIPCYRWAFLLLTSLLTSLFLSRKKLGQSLCVFALLVSLGGFWASFSYSKLGIKLPRGKRLYNAVLLTEPIQHGKVMQADMLILTQKVPVKIKASILRDTITQHYSTLHLADGVQLYGELQHPTNFVNSNFDYAEYLKLHGYGAELFIFDSQWQIAKVSLAPMNIVDRTLLRANVLRQKYAKLLKTTLNESQLAVVSAMMLGDKSYISKSLKDDYSITGASHVLALSGLHLSIIYAILWMLLTSLGNILTLFKRKELKNLLLLLTIWAYVFLVGFSPSVVRSALMLSVYSFIALLGRDKMSLNTLAVAAFCILLYNPLTLFDVSFQLSFSAVASILLFYPIFNAWFCSDFFIKHKWLLWFPQMVAMTLSAQIGTAPLVAFYFSKFSTYFLLSSFVAIPCTTIILYAGVIFFAFMWFAPLQWLAIKVLSFTTIFLNTSLHWLATLPKASISIHHLTVLQVILIYFMLLILLTLMTFFGRRIKFR